MGQFGPLGFYYIPEIWHFFMDQIFCLFFPVVLLKCIFLLVLLYFWVDYILYLLIVSSYINTHICFVNKYNLYEYIDSIPYTFHYYY